MGPPRDRLAAMQQAAYFEEGDDYGVPMEDAMDGKHAYFMCFNCKHSTLWFQNSQ